MQQKKKQKKNLSCKFKRVSQMRSGCLCYRCSCTWSAAAIVCRNSRARSWCHILPLGNPNFTVRIINSVAFCLKIHVFLDLLLRKKLVECYIWSMALYGGETWTLRAVDQKYLESFEMWCWRRMEKISWTDHVRNEEVLLRVNEQRNILHEIRKRKANWIDQVLRRNCRLK